VTIEARQWLTASDTRLVVDDMTSIRIAIAAALMLAAVFAGGLAHASRSQTPTPARYDALAAGAVHDSPILCCEL